MDPQQLPKTSKFYFICNKCDKQKTARGGYHPLGSLKVKSEVVVDTSGSRTSETGGGKLLPKCLNDLFKAFPKKFQHFPKKFNLSPKISDDFLFSHRSFSCFNVVFIRRGSGQIRSRHRYGGPQSLHFDNSQYYHYSFCPRGGPNSIANFDGRVMAGFAPWIRHWLWTYDLT